MHILYHDRTDIVQKTTCRHVWSTQCPAHVADKFNFDLYYH